MAYRTTEDDVRQVLGDDYDTSRSLRFALRSAYAVVTRVATCAAAKNKTLSAEELALVEMWLAAHFYQVSDRQYASHATGGASGAYMGTSGLNLDGSTYGQAAKAVDYSGCLAGLDKRMTAGGDWLGRPPSEQTPYYQRD